MSFAPLLADGIYRARARSAKHSQTADGVPYVEVDLEVYPHYDLVGGVPKQLGDPVRISWRGWKTRGSASRTIAALVAMGAYFPDENDPDRFVELGSVKCEAEIISVECDDREAEGRWRTFVLRVKPCPNFA